MVGPHAKRKALALVQELRGLSVRRACGLVGLHQSTFYYHGRGKDEVPLRERMLEIARTKTRYGRPRMVLLLRRAGFSDNHKRIGRIYRELGLQVTRRKGKRKRSGIRLALALPVRANERWSMDFVSDALNCGRKFRSLNIVDDFTRESVAIEVDTCLSGDRVARVLSGLRATRGLPKAIVCDNGPEFTSRALDQWAFQNQVDLKFIQPGKPNQNAYVESFNGRFRDECLNENWFLNLEDARLTISIWRKDYNTQRPHSSLKNETPESFALKNQVVVSA